MDTIRWGILGTGNIAKQFARGLTALDDAKLVAVGSRTQESADKFADQFDAPRRHASYEALVNDPNVDAIYVATPHPFHCENTLLCIDAGKAVLCEKPFAINDAEAKRMIDAARSKGIFLMEAMWSRFFPLMVDVRRRIAEGEIGNVRMMTADFGFRVGTVNPKSRLFDPALGGGALLDVGVYPVSLASMVFGNATRIATLANLGETGVDEEAGIVLGYEGGQIAALHTAVRVTTPQEAIFMGENGSIRVHTRWWTPDTMTVNGEVVNVPYEGNGYNYEAAEVGRCLREGETESDTMPLDETLAVMKTLTEIRAQWGLKYPME